MRLILLIAFVVALVAVAAPPPQVGQNAVVAIRQTNRDKIVSRANARARGLYRRADPSAKVYPKCTGSATTGTSFAILTGSFYASTYISTAYDASTVNACAAKCKASTDCAIAQWWDYGRCDLYRSFTGIVSYGTGQFKVPVKNTNCDTLIRTYGDPGTTYTCCDVLI